MEEAASRQEEGEAGRLSIDHLCDTAFLELGPRGLGHHAGSTGFPRWPFPDRGGEGQWSDMENKVWQLYSGL